MRFGLACLVRRIKDSKSAPLVSVGVRARDPAVHACMAVGYTRNDGTGGASSAGREVRCGAQGVVSSDTHRESRALHFDGCRLRAKFRAVFVFSEYRESPQRAAGNVAAGNGTGDALFCVVGKIPRAAHGSLPRPLRLDVAFRLAAGADVSEAGVLSPAAVGRRAGSPLYFGVFSGGPSRARG